MVSHQQYERNKELQIPGKVMNIVMMNLQRKKIIPNINKCHIYIHGYAIPSKLNSMEFVKNSAL